MKKYIPFLLLTITLLTSSCDKCDEGDKAIPASIFVEVIDETTLENVFENETFTAAQISVKDLDDNLIPFNFIPNNNLIQLFPTTENPIGNTFIITLNNETTSTMEEITITHDVSEKKEECYTTYKIENVQVPNNPSELVNGIYVIKM
jgi:hypothetical protein